jgi:pilus assembly protein CpaB
LNLARVILIVAALAVAGLTAFLVNLLISQKDDDETDVTDVATAEILVADRALPAGLIVTGEHFVWQSWPKNLVNKNFIVRKKDVKIERYIGYVVKSLFNAGEPILANKLIKPGTPGFLPGALKPGMRAFTIKVSPITGSSGFILPGMYVDLVMTHRGTIRGSRQLISETIMQNVRVLAIDQRVSDGGKAAQRAKNITVEVSPKEVEKLSISVRIGQIRLVVRSLARDPDEEKLAPFTMAREISDFMRLTSTGNPSLMVAKINIAKGALLRNVDVECRAFPHDTKIDGQISCSPNTIQTLKGSLVLEDVKAGQSLLRNHIMTSREDGFITATMKPGMRAVTIFAGNLSTPTNFLAAGDHIDILLTSTVRARQNQYGVLSKRVSETVMNDLRILAMRGGALTLEMTPNQAQRIILARTMGAFTVLARRHDDKASMPRYASDFDASRAYADSFTKDPVEGLAKYDREQDRAGGVDQTRTRVYGGNVPSVLNIFPDKYQGTTDASGANSPQVIVVPEANKSE